MSSLNSSYYESNGNRWSRGILFITPCFCICITKLHIQVKVNGMVSFSVVIEGSRAGLLGAKLEANIDTSNAPKDKPTLPEAISSANVAITTEITPTRRKSPLFSSLSTPSRYHYRRSDQIRDCHSQLAYLPQPMMLRPYQTSLLLNYRLSLNWIVETT